MDEPWFDPNRWAWLPGTLLGLLAGGWGSLAGVLVPRGRGRAFLTTTYWLFLVVGAVLLVGGIVAVYSEQPFGVWFALVLAGVLTHAVIGPLGFVLFRAYRMHEERRMAAQDFG